jgi:chromosome segregation ATPase
MSDELKPCANFGIGDEVCIHGYVDEIRRDTVIIRNDGGYFGTVLHEVTPNTANTRSDDAPKQTVDNAQADSRERLEADAMDFCEHFYVTERRYSELMKLLDRQAAITAEETSNAWEEYRDATQREIDGLTAERDELRERVRKLTMKIMAMEDKHKIDSERWVGIAHQHQEDLHEIMELRGKLQGIGDLNTVQSRRIEELEAERDELRDKLAEKQRVIDVQRDSFLKLEAENAELRRMLSDAADAF